MAAGRSSVTGPLRRGRSACRPHPAAAGRP